MCSVGAVSFLLIPCKCPLCLAPKNPVMNFWTLCSPGTSAVLVQYLVRQSLKENWISHSGVVINGFTATFSLLPGLLYQHTKYIRYKCNSCHKAPLLTCLWNLTWFTGSFYWMLFFLVLLYYKKLKNTQWLKHSLSVYMRLNALNCEWCWIYHRLLWKKTFCHDLRQWSHLIQLFFSKDYFFFFFFYFEQSWETGYLVIGICLNMEGGVLAFMSGESQRRSHK